MDFNSYYQKQADGNYFRGASFQKGYGLGGAFRRFFSWFIPLIKEHALPVVKTIGKEVVNGVANIASDTINGEDLEDSTKKRIKETFMKLNQSGKGYKRKRNLKNKRLKKNHRLVDIFS